MLEWKETLPSTGGIDFDEDTPTFNKRHSYAEQFSLHTGMYKPKGSKNSHFYVIYPTTDKNINNGVHFISESRDLANNGLEPQIC